MFVVFEGGLSIRSHVRAGTSAGTCLEVCLFRFCSISEIANGFDLKQNLATNETRLMYVFFVVM
jgi:hypothetical protein